MAVSENGRPAESKTDSSNAPSPTLMVRRRPAKRRSWSSWMMNSIARLAVWYALFTILFRCPSAPSQLSDQSPGLCRPYLTAKAYVQPHLQLYYDEYAAPYMAKVQPYTQLVNERVVGPASTMASANYEKYAAPQIAAAKTYSKQRWDASVVPQIDLVRGRAAHLYDTNLAPHVDAITRQTGPYYSSSRDAVIAVYAGQVSPALTLARHYAQDAYHTSRGFVSTTAYPWVRHTWSELVVFTEGTLWPSLKGLYIDNVRPQLVMINERIAKYQESRKVKAAMDEVDRSRSAPAPSGTPGATVGLEDVYAMFETEEAPDTSSTTAEEPRSTGPPKSRPPPEYATDEQIVQDLRVWQKKFAVAADKGSDDLRERVGVIVSSLVKSDIDGVGHGLADALQTTVDNELANVKTRTKSVISALPENAGPEEIKRAAEDILAAIRSSGTEIKLRAKNVRTWAQTFEKSLIQRLAAASATTLEVLDGVKDLGLQDVGMRWAWMEGVTYKHWEKFHEVRRKLDEWKLEVRSVAMESPQAEEAIGTARQILEESMAITEDAAKELVRLKGVAQWKLKERDPSDDFDSRSMPAPVASAVSSLVTELQGGAETAQSIISQAAETTTDPAIVSPSSVAADPKTGTLDAVASDANEIAAEALSWAASAVGISSSPSPTASGPGTTDVADQDDKEADKSIAEAVESPEPTASSSPPPTDPTIILSEDETAANAIPTLDPSGTETPASNIFPGAVAQEVSGSVPFFEDNFDDDPASVFSEHVQSLVNEAGDRYADVTRAVSEAMFGTSQGALQSVTSVASEQYASALAAASRVLYGAPQGTAESLVSVASEKYADAVAAASSVFFGTPAPLTDSVLRQASSLYTDAVSRAEENYWLAKSIASRQIAGTTKPIHEKMLSSIDSAYSGALHAASSRFDDARSAASGQFVAMTRGPSKSNPLVVVTAMASSILQDSLAAASSQYSRAKAAVGATPEPAHSKYLQEVRKNYYAAIGMAHEQYEEFNKAASAAIYGTPAPAYQSLIDAASANYAVASSAAAANLASYRSSIQSAATPVQSLLDDAVAAYSEAVAAASSSLFVASYAASTAVYGTPTPLYQSALAVASDQYLRASSAAAARMSAMLDSASSVVGTKKNSPAQDVIDAISSQYDAALAAAASSLSVASAAASTAAYGGPSAPAESLSRVASENWDALISKASLQIYGTPEPLYSQFAAQAGEYSEQISDLAADKYVVIQSFVSELIVGREPAFTESAISRLSSAYYTGYSNLASSASAFAGEAFDSASSLAASVSSVAGEYLPTPPAVSSILDSVTEQINSAVEAASVQIYGTAPGKVEHAASVLADSYSAASECVSHAIYGTPVGYAEAAQETVASIAKNAHEAIQLALYGTSAGAFGSMTDAAGQVYSSMSFVAVENAATAASVIDAAKAHVSEAVYGSEPGALDVAQSRIAAAVESARSAISSMASDAAERRKVVEDAIGSKVAEAASSVGSNVGSALKYVKDEL